MTVDPFHTTFQLKSSLLEAVEQLRASSKLTSSVTAQPMKQGIKMLRSDWKQMQAYYVPVPSIGLLSIFDDVIHLYFSQLKSLSVASQKLPTARDLLLPRLMSGELAV
jgi:type I restriction enzyme, S subunit